MYEYKYILLHNNNYDIYVKIMDVLVIIGTVYFDLISLASPVKSSLNSVCLLFGLLFGPDLKRGYPLRSLKTLSESQLLHPGPAASGQNQNRLYEACHGH